MNSITCYDDTLGTSKAIRELFYTTCFDKVLICAIKEICVV